MSIKKELWRFRYHWSWYLVPFVAVLGLTAAMFSGEGAYYWGPLESDLTNQFYPWRVFIHRWFSRGVFPYWDPHIFSGYPTIESQQMLNMHPLYVLSLLMKPELGVTAFTALNTVIAFVGMAWGLRRCGRCTVMAAAFGAGLYVFGALFAVRVMAGHITVVTALAWWPVAALSTLRIVRQMPGSRGEGWYQREKAGLAGIYSNFRNNSYLRRLMALSALAHGLVCLAGAPQYIVYLFYLDMAILAAVARRYTWAASLAALAAVWVVALTVSAPQWLPAMWYLPYTGRALSSGGATGLDFSPMRNILLEMVMPWPFGDDVTHGHLHFKNVWETATYPGGAALVLSLALVARTVGWRLNRLRGRGGAIAPVTPLGAAAAVVLLLAVYMMVGGWLPGFSGFREPLKARALLAFGFAVGSAAILDLGILRGGIWKKSLWIGVAIAGLLIAEAGRYTGMERFKELVRGFGQPMDPLAHRDYQQFLFNPGDAAIRYYVAYTAGTLGVLFVVLLLVGKAQMRRVLVGFLFLAALADPLFHHARSWVARHPWERAGLPEPIAEYFQPRLRQSEGELPWRVVLHPGIINRTHHMEGLYEYYGYDPLMPAQAVGRMLVKGVRNDEAVDKATQRRELLKRVGARYDASQWLPRGGGEDGDGRESIIEVPEATLFDVTRKVIAGSPGAQWFGPDLNGNHYLLPAEEGGLASSAGEAPEEFRREIEATFGAAGASTASEELGAGESVTAMETGRPDEYGVKVELDSPAAVVYKGTWLPGWRVWIDGEDQGQALFANNWMPAAIVPEGRHEVVFRYRPVAFGWSLAMAAGGVVMVLLLALRPGRRGRG